jgi:hypothetical protein
LLTLRAMSITQQAKDALAAVQGGRSREAVDIASGALKRIKDGEEASARCVRACVCVCVFAAGWLLALTLVSSAGSSSCCTWSAG